MVAQYVAIADALQHLSLVSATCYINNKLSNSSIFYFTPLKHKIPHVLLLLNCHCYWHNGQTKPITRGSQGLLLTRYPKLIKKEKPGVTLSY
ncbi:hypothetical protein XELAEV_18012730mg [Xenopus laevis]|uniref:Uncharacterized protein n=1 Tax=Xenopus laevis TaxID=8355 RepID=A0A974DNP0_XENLA|nr:hypothetical protein XELAEV_18012730mg [Xenopus laevis]